MMGDTFLEKIRRRIKGIEFEKEGGAVGDEFFRKFGAAHIAEDWYSANTSFGDL